MCIYIYTHIHLYVCMYIYICIYREMYISLYIYTYIYIYIYMYTHMSIQAAGLDLAVTFRDYWFTFEDLYLPLSIYISISLSLYIYMYIYIHNGSPSRTCGPRSSATAGCSSWAAFSSRQMGSTRMESLQNRYLSNPSKTVLLQ